MGLGLVIGFGKGTGTGLGFDGIVTVLVVVCVVVEPAMEPEVLTQTVTDPDPIREPWLSPGIEDPTPEHAIAPDESKPTSAAAKTTLTKLKLICCIFLMSEK